LQTLYDELEGSQEEDEDFAQWELGQLKKSGVKKSGKNLPAGIRGAMYDAQIQLPEYKRKSVKQFVTEFIVLIDLVC